MKLFRNGDSAFRGPLQLERKFCAELEALRPELEFVRTKNGTFRAVANEVTVVVHGKVIRASNGEVAGWPIANVIKGSSESHFYSAPWLEGGCTAEAVIKTYDHYRG